MGKEDYKNEKKGHGFLCVPKELLFDNRYKQLTIEAILLYAYMLDRLKLSIENGWKDSDGKVFIYFSLESIMDLLKCSKGKAISTLKELDEKHGIGLIEKKRSGYGKCSRIYVKEIFELSVSENEKTREKNEEDLEVTNKKHEKSKNKMSRSSKIEPIEVKKINPKLTVIAHVACNNTKDSQELARHAESLGVDAIAAIPPIYFHLPEYAIAQYWNDISAAAPNTDFVIYNIPQLAGVALTQGLFAEMRKNPNVIGVKNSSMPVQDIQMFKQAAGPDYIIFNGPDEQFMSGRVIGAEGAIGGTYGVMPELYLKLDEYVRAGKMEEAREIQYACDEIIYKMCSAHGNMYAVIKAILKINEGLELGGVKEPLPGLIDEDSDIVKKAAQMICDAKKKYL